MGCMVANAQTNMVKPKLSAFTQRYLRLQQHSGQNAAPVPQYVYKIINGKTYISGLIKVNKDIDQSRLDALGVYTGTKAGNVWTTQIPLDRVTEFTNMPGISYICLDEPLVPAMDSARRQTRADSAQKGINLPLPVTGKNVILGIIDAGFDFNHPGMFDTTYSRYRIRKVWTQKLTGTPPAGFAYGHELTDSNMVKAAGYDTAIMSHGAHVAGIAGGSGYGSNAANNRFRGMAYESDMVLVGIMPDPMQWISTGASDIVDGLNYIFTYAASVSMPAVVNLSWGSTIGTHDGSSLFSEACDALTGPGKIFVCAAGNNGQDTVHLQKAFSATDTSVSTFVTFSPYLDTNKLGTWLDVWGDTAKPFCLGVQLYNGATAIDSTGFVCLDDNDYTFKLVGSNGDTCTVSITTAVSDYNNRPHAFVDIQSKVKDNICLTVKATDGVVNMWEGYVLPPSGYYGALKQLGYPWAVSGDAKMTVSDIGTTKSAITVGAYASKVSFVNISGTALSYPGASKGKMAPFSSPGQTADNRIKPDITAPGFAVAASVSSFDTSYKVGGPNYNGVISQYTDGVSGRTYKYAMLAGTSMAAPCVAGIVAMMLQINPLLTPDDTKAIINATAIKDIHTGVLPPEGTNLWGHGKINGYAAINYLAQKASVKHVNMDPLDCIVYPNPNKGTYTISYTSKINEQATIEVYDAAGKLVSSNKWQVSRGGNTHEMNLAGLPKGMYFTKVSAGKGYNTIKTIVE